MTIGVRFDIRECELRRPIIKHLLGELADGHLVDVSFVTFSLESDQEQRADDVRKYLDLIEISMRLTIGLELLHLGLQMNALYSTIAHNPDLQHNRCNFCWLSQVIIFSPSICKRVFSINDNEHPFWKSFMMATFQLILSFKQDGNDPKWSDTLTEPGVVLWTFWKSMTFWNENQVRFALRNDLVRIIVKEKGGMVSCLLMHKILKITRKFKTKSIVEFRRTHQLKIKRRHPNYEEPNGLKRKLSDITNLYLQKINPKYFPCGWPLCSKLHSKWTPLKICSGCRMVRYCCKNHQKKHWKFVHSQQCSFVE